ncbi:MAG: hypothetical protein ACMUHM_07930, partial [Thermoplasmatota archaeon]
MDAVIKINIKMQMTGHARAPKPLDLLSAFMDPPPSSKLLDLDLFPFLPDQTVRNYAPCGED